MNNPEATGAIIAAGAASAVRVMLEQNARMHVLLLAITPRGERCAPSSLSEQAVLDAAAQFDPLLEHALPAAVSLERQETRRHVVPCMHESGLMTEMPV